MKHGDDYQYTINGSGEPSYKLDSIKYLKMKYMLYVPGWKKNIISVSRVYEKGIRVAFVDGQVLMCPKGNTIDDATITGEEEGGLTS